MSYPPRHPPDSRKHGLFKTQTRSSHLPDYTLPATPVTPCIKIPLLSLVHRLFILQSLLVCNSHLLPNLFWHLELPEVLWVFPALSSPLPLELRASLPLFPEVLRDYTLPKWPSSTGQRYPRTTNFPVTTTHLSLVQKLKSKPSWSCLYLQTTCPKGSYCSICSSEAK